MEYIFRVILCSGFFISIYYAFLQNERMHKVNRLYLVFSALGTLVIPLIKLKNINLTIEQVDSFVSNGTGYVNNSIEALSVSNVASISWENVAAALYFIIVFILFFRFLMFNLLLVRKVKQCDFVQLTDAILALTPVDHPPHSFLKYIFISKSDYFNGKVDQSIIDHERVHISQKHTLDIFLIELLLSILWFNPFFYLYRNAIRLNHEFLADEAVIKQNGNSTHYQYLIIKETAESNGLVLNQHLSCSFNYLKTKKRLEMMKRVKITHRITIKLFALIPAILVAIVLFSDSTIAQEVKKVVALNDSYPIQNQLASEDVLQSQFDALLKPYVKEKNGKTVYYGIDQAAQKQLIPLYKKMSKSQKARQIVQFMPGLKEHKPSKEEFEKWKDPQMYGVWLNEKRINNELLSNYSNTDISHFSISRLAKNAKNYGKHLYHLSARTNNSFEAYNKRLKDDPYLVFKRQWEKN